MSPASNQPAANPSASRAMLCCRSRTFALAALGLAALTLGGCVKPLLSPDEERSPFDRYDGIRAQYAPQYTTDEYGLRKPNLRNRLGNKD